MNNSNIVENYSPAPTTRDAAATTIQSYWRGRLAKAQVEKAKRNFLCNALFEKAKPLINSSDLSKMPKASSGKTHVYFPQGLPVALKHSGSPQNQVRFEKMKQARGLCERIGSNDLVIPKARPYLDFIIETKLPISKYDWKEQVGIYVNNSKQFTNVVREFTRFHCQSSLSDIATISDEHYGTLSDSCSGRYDNIVLYLDENEVGKIGLIDLEQFDSACDRSKEDWCFQRCQDLIILFPYHFDDIIEVAKGFDPDIENYREKLIAIQNESLLRFKLVYEDHQDFVEKKGITLENPASFEKLNSNELEQVKDGLRRHLYQMHETQRQYPGLLGKDPESTLTLFFEESFPIILNAIFESINTKLNYRRNEFEAVSSMHELVALRTLILDFNEIEYDCVWMNGAPIHIPKFPEIKLEMFKFPEIFFVSFKEEILYSIFSEFVKCGKIAYFEPNQGYGSPRLNYIFC